MTKQSMGQLAVDLEKRGYIQRVIDPRDHRATLILFTAAGWQFLQDAYQVKGEIETEYRAFLGDERQHSDHEIFPPTRSLYLVCTAQAESAFNRSCIFSFVC